MPNFEALLDALETDGWAVADQLLPDTLIMQLRQAGRQAWRQGLFRDAHVGSPKQPIRNTVIRGDTIHWLEPSHPAAGCQAFLEWADTLRLALNRAFYVGLRRAEFHFARYGAGQGYQRHIDQHQGQPHRKISLVLYLNRVWQDDNGGELCLYDPQAPDTVLKKVQPRLGRIVVFRSDLIPHAVLPCTRPRWSLTGWFRSDDALIDLGTAPPAANDDFPGSTPSGAAA
ncbi:2OG-Fe(II) oxygenase [Pusillimonas sp. TS35]|uniref:2OG-Fe(II) oxygenase n=1 Tax=Paracandidimonas lactea TaxID=2895524 RepID=UPI00136EA388|nr:2OG-Fe(II) oxygenase [Paracandidimonas lactea]MYN11574.1 2OG-Fe(II) oxygenase [Pusillimonas sp. TS35]